MLSSSPEITNVASFKLVILPYLKNSNIIEVESINALLDAQNELRIPIAYFETKKNKEGCFVIVNGKEAWQYIFKIEDEK